MLRAILQLGVIAVTIGMVADAGNAQSTASTYSYGTYNPVQAAINRNSMNAAILRQAARGHRQNGVRHGHGRVARRR